MGRRCVDGHALLRVEVFYVLDACSYDGQTHDDSDDKRDERSTSLDLCSLGILFLPNNFSLPYPLRTSTQSSSTLPSNRKFLAPGPAAHDIEF